VEKQMSAAKKQVSVTVSKDGPYIVSGGAPLTKQTIVANADGESLEWQEGEPYDAPAKYALCRCGHTHRAPFCDGTHAKIGFDGTETAERAPYSAQRTVFATARSLPFWMRSTCARTAGSATRTEKYGNRSPTPTIRKFARCFCARCIIVPRGAWSPSTKPLEQRSRNIYLSRSV